MTTILLALIAGILAFQLLNELSGKEEDIGVLAVTIPASIVLIMIAGVVILGVAGGIHFLFGLFGISL